MSEQPQTVETRLGQSEPGSLPALLAEHLVSPEFSRAVLSVPLQTGSAPWQKITIRKVELARGTELQIARFDGKQVYTKTVAVDDPLVTEVASLGFRNLTVQLVSALIEYRVSKKGKVLTTRTNGPTTVSTAHDRTKSRLIPENAPFLESLGLASGGSVKPTGQKKYRQVNEFVKAVMGSDGIDEILRESPVRIIDFGCGNAYLTFAIYHYLHEVLDLPCEVRGIDRDGPLMQRANERAQQLGWTGLTFERGTIDDAPVTTMPHIVIALHACDTATDDVLARTVGWGSQLVLVAPCCQHDIQRQMQLSAAPTDYASMVRKGLLKERLGDVLTDSLRCDVLGLLGYHSEVIEFISLEHTAKNLMIRARQTNNSPSTSQVQQYRSLCDQWNVTPYLERALKAQLRPILEAARPGAAYDISATS